MRPQSEQTTTVPSPPHHAASPQSFLPSPPLSFDESRGSRLLLAPDAQKISPGVEKKYQQERRRRRKKRKEQEQLARKALQTAGGEETKKKHFSQLQHYLRTGNLLTVVESGFPLCFDITDSEFRLLLDALSDRQYKAVRVDYNPITSTGRLWMPTPLHDCVASWADEMLTDIKADLLPRSHRRILEGSSEDYRLAISYYSTSHGPETAYVPPSTSSRKRKHTPESPSSRKTAAITKSPDYSYRCGEEKYPRVVFESGWSEKAKALADDAEQWLVKTSGRTRVVVTVLLTEENSPFNARKKELRAKYIRLHEEKEQEDEEEDEEKENTEKANNALPKTPVRGGRGGGRGANNKDNDKNNNRKNRKPASSPLSDAPSTASDHIAKFTALDPSLWVGPVTAHVIIWRFNRATGRPYRDGPVYLLHPDGSSSPTGAPAPQIPLGELCDLQEVGLGRAGEGDLERLAWTFDFPLLRNKLQRSKREYAFRRMQDAEYLVRGEFGLE